MLKNRRFEDEDSGFGIRHLQVFFLFSALSMGFAMRVNLSVAVVAMAEFPEYKWSEKIKSLVLSSFFWGYVITQIPAGPLARRFGGKVTILTGSSICSVLTILTPLCAKLGGWQLLCTVRLLEGLCQGFLFPSCHTVLSAWVPPKERATLGNFTYAGNQFGIIVMLATSGLLISMGGWPSVFYASGAVGCIWSIIYYIWGASSPADSKSISAEERTLIELGQAGERNDSSEQPSHHQITPWMRFFRSPAVLALIVVQSAYAYGFWTLLTQIPSYMKYILGKDIKANALLSALPSAAMLTLCFIFAWLSKLMQKKDSISLSFNRKFFNSIGTFGPMCLLIALGYVPQDKDTLSVVLITLTVGLISASHVGFLINHIDLTPNYAGIIMGICNCVANCMSLAAPLLVGVIVTDQHNPHQWRMVFFVAAGIYLVGNGVFLIFGRTNVQPWNDPSAEQQKPGADTTEQLESQTQNK
ncbi:putative inorganic phosphate cotransporter [Drosophila grimshawi]|uniref:Putative inorganic phosphate cotransporter n=1 Tax=Drosophila grimshawi TaxID=7222 RepID=B4JA21_DROGR|nr:putative inorganic phosphate cotransporter [Drosophila grimshawi]EDW02608.1 GH19797 [Drosophila grimshawi]